MAMRAEKDFRRLAMFSGRIGSAPAGGGSYAISGSTSGTIDRVKRRILGTAIGVPLGLVCLPLATSAPVVVWAAAALAMVIYAMALPERYDVARGAYAFTLIVTLAVSG